MLQGMQKKNKDRADAQKKSDRELGIIAESSRQKKVMQTYFERKEHVKREDKRLRLNTDRGINLHRYSDMKYKNGALNISKGNLNKYTKDAGPDDRYAHLNYNKPNKVEKERMTYEKIKAQRDINPEFATGKKYKRSKGSQKKLVKQKRKG